MSTLTEAAHALLLAQQEEKTAAWERTRNAQKLREGLLHETALRLMKVRRAVDGRARFDVPTEWLSLVKDSTVPQSGVLCMHKGRGLRHWDLIEPFVLEGASLAQLGGWYRMSADTVEKIIRDDLHTLALMSGEEKPDPRDPDPTREGMFRDHNCWKCRSGEKPCVKGNPRQCEYPHARND